VVTRGAHPRGDKSTRRRGAVAESEARAFLLAQGYTILDHNHTVRGGELDVVAQDGPVLCFVEVKTRASAAFGQALEGVTPRKARRVVLAAQRWLLDHPVDAPLRFDVVTRDGNGPWVLCKDAFRPEPEST
jgi:putative endonuclease